MARGKKPQQLTVEPAQWPATTAVKRVSDLMKRGRGLQGRNASDEERNAWSVAVDSTMAAAFGKNSDEHLNAKSAIDPIILGFIGGWDSPPPPDDYPERLSKQLSVIEEYLRVLEQRAADEAAHAPQPEAPPPAVDTVLHILSRFSRAAKHLKTRRSNRPPLLIQDEYDVQYLLHALLDVHFDDVRPEEFGPSTAGQNVRIDFVLENEKIAVEAKMTRATLKDRDVGDELFADIKRYQKHLSCKTLVCFIYDPEGHLKNPDGLENDLSRVHDGLDVRVVVRPKH